MASVHICILDIQIRESLFSFPTPLYFTDEFCSHARCSDSEFTPCIFELFFDKHIVNRKCTIGELQIIPYSVRQSIIITYHLISLITSSQNKDHTIRMKFLAVLIPLHFTASNGKSPKYEVTDNYGHFKVKLDAPGFKPEEIEVDLKAGGTVLSVSGHHEVEEEGQYFQSTFWQTFSLDPSILIEELSVNFQGGKVVVSAPRNAERLYESRKIPIKMSSTEEK